MYVLKYYHEYLYCISKDQISFIASFSNLATGYNLKEVVTLLTSYIVVSLKPRVRNAGGIVLYTVEYFMCE